MAESSNTLDIKRNYVRSRKLWGDSALRVSVSAVFAGNTPKDAPPSILLPPSYVSSSHPFRTTSGTSPHTGCFLPSLLIAQQPGAPKFVRTIPPRWRLRSPSCQPAPAGPTPTSPWASVSTGRMWLWRAGPLLLRVGGEEAKGTEYLLSCKTFSSRMC